PVARTPSLHDALPIFVQRRHVHHVDSLRQSRQGAAALSTARTGARSRARPVEQILAARRARWGWILTTRRARWGGCSQHRAPGGSEGLDIDVCVNVHTGLDAADPPGRMEA